MKKATINILNLIWLIFVFYLRQRGIISNAFFIIALLAGMVVISAISIRSTLKSRSDMIKRLKENSAKALSDPDGYISEINDGIENSRGYERDYLILHKANTLAKLGRDSEACFTLKDHRPLYLDKDNLGVYYNNLLGLLIKQNRIGEAKSIVDEYYKTILDPAIDSSIGYSILINLASLKQKEGKTYEALELLEKAKYKTSDEKIKENIEEIKSKLQN